MRFTVPVRPYRSGFTVIELLVVVLILTLFMAVALPLYLSAAAESEKAAARVNMETIADAEKSYKMQNADHVYTKNIADLFDLPQGMSGPDKRIYYVTFGPNKCTGPDRKAEIVPVGSYMVTSSTPDDGCYVPGITPE